MGQPLAEDFWGRLQTCGLLSPDQLRVVDELRAVNGSEPLENVRSQLVSKKLLTPWQDQQLALPDGMTLKLGQYVLLNHLGTGGMSRVYLAEHARLKRRVAIKVLPVDRTEDRSYLRRFHREARAIAQLDHPNIVRAYGCDSQGELHYLVMEYVAGLDLDRLVRKSGVVDPRLAADYIRQAAVGLAHAHERGMIHRDIKPANLLLDRKQVIKILDLGLARLDRGGEESSVTLELRETVIGTVDFMAPEQAIDSHSIDARADIYSLGYTLYYLLVGKPPFPSGTLAQRLLRHQTVEPIPESELRADVPSGLIAIRERMTAKKPADRFATMSEVAAALEVWKGGSQASYSCLLARPAPPREQIRPSVEPEIGLPSEVIKPPVSAAAVVSAPQVSGPEGRTTAVPSMLTWLLIAGGLLLAGGLTAASWQSGDTVSMTEDRASPQPQWTSPSSRDDRYSTTSGTSSYTSDTWQQGQANTIPPPLPPSEGLPIAAMSDPGLPGLIISEYIEGPFHNKALEFCNASDTDVDTADYELLIRGFSSSGNAFTGNIPLRSKVLRPGETFVLTIDHTQADFPGVDADQRHARLAFNGDDALILWNRNADRAEDVFGVEGHDPGDYWSHDGVATEGQTLTRHASVRSGARNGFVPLDRLSREWVASEEGSHSLGKHELATD